MLNIYETYNDLKETINAEAANVIMKLVSKILEFIYEEEKKLVTKVEFNELKEIVRELAEAQKRSEERLDKLTEEVKELAEAQKRSEKRLDKLTEEVKELAEAQKRTEKRVEELAETQKKTEKILQIFIKDFKSFKRYVGDITDSLGYKLENESYIFLPTLLKRDYGIDIEGELNRCYVKDNWNNDIEVNIYGKGKKEGKEIVIIGEVKSKLSKNKIDKFIKNKIKRIDKVFDNIFPVLVTHQISSNDVKDYAMKNNIVLYLSYNFK